MSEQGPDKGPGQISWLIQSVVAAVALYFVADGLLGMWPDASTTTRVVVVVAVLVVAFVVVGLVYLARRGRQD